MATTASLPAYLLQGVTIHQPPHLEGDSALATEILPGPPSLVSAQQAAQKRDPRKPSTVYSYLPLSDPGSTYSGLMHGTLIGQDFEGPRNKRSRVDKGTATGRAQRASARNQGGNTSMLDPSMQLEAGTSSASQPILLESDSGTVVVDDEITISRSNSSLNLQDSALLASGGKSKRKDKGKAKEEDTPPLRVKEEPKPFSLHTPEPPNLLNNEDHCSSCRSYGALVYCDGCPRAFHLWCLDPPMEGVDDGDARWFCPTCAARKHPPRKPPPSLLSSLIHQLQVSIPVEFQLPEDIKTFFKDVASGPKGNYVDSSEIKQPRLNRHGQLEDRDPHRLRDRNGDPILCFQCGMSALPSSLAATAPAAKRARSSTSKGDTPDAWKIMVSCDYCTLHWHLDCLDPPLPTLPPFNKKWMCPNHAERVLPPKRRIPKQNVPPIEIVKPRQYNNGNIEVIHPELSTAAPNPRIAVDEVLINGRRYRIPEKIIVLDFWSKLNKRDEYNYREMDIPSRASSPLTPLSSMDDSHDSMLSSSGRTSTEIDDLAAAQLLCNMATAKKSTMTVVRASGATKKLADRGVQTNPEPPVVRNKVGRPRKHPYPILNGTPQQVGSRSSESLNTATSLTISTVRRRRASQQIAPEASTRELRSRSKNTNFDTSLTSISSRVRSSSLSTKCEFHLGADQSSLKQGGDFGKESGPILDGSVSNLPTSQSKARLINIKLEDVDHSPLLMSETFLDPLIASSSAPAKTPRPIRTPRQIKQKDIDVSRKDTKEKWGRKRKARDDESPGGDAENGFEPLLRDSTKKGKEEKGGGEKERETKKPIRTPVRPTQFNMATPAASPATASLPTTPSLKIRLPPTRLQHFKYAATLPSAHSDTSTPR